MTLDALILSLGFINLLALCGVVLIGLPHGAFDGAIAACLGQTRGPLTLVRFIALYVALAGFVVWLWLAFPAPSLIGFLTISIIHFGLGDTRKVTGWFRYVQAVAHGGVVVAGISQSHRLEVDIIFGYLVGGDTKMAWMAIDIVSVMIVSALAIYAWRALLEPKWRKGFFEASLLLLMLITVPPLVGFALYFCCVHSTRHLWSVWTAVKEAFPRNILFAGAILFTFASWIIGAVIFWWCANFMPVESALLRVIFIGLAALTVPHMILVDGFFRANSSKSIEVNRYG